MIVTLDSMEHNTNSHEVDITLGSYVFLSVDMMPECQTPGVYCPWEKLSLEQQARFQAVHGEFMDVVGRLQTMFIDVPRPAPGEEW